MEQLEVLKLLLYYDFVQDQQEPNIFTGVIKVKNRNCKARAVFNCDNSFSLHTAYTHEGNPAISNIQISLLTKELLLSVLGERIDGTVNMTDIDEILGNMSRD